MQSAVTRLEPPKSNHDNPIQNNSPEDHAILEAQYQINPKPDKLGRTHIVMLVSLGEKEVQVRDAKTRSAHNVPPSG